MAFVLQGEGRGHFTQALAAAAHLRAACHRIVDVHVGTGPEWPIPSFFTDGIGAPVSSFVAPTHIPDRSGPGMSPGRTTWNAISRLPRFTASGLRLLERLRRDRVDVVVAFFDVVSAFSRVASRAPAPTVVVGHHYLLDHPASPAIPAGLAARVGFRALTRVTGMRSHLRLALSFRDLPKGPDPRLRVTPPLLRDPIRTLTPSDEGYLLAYTVNSRSLADVLKWHESRPEVEVHCYAAGGADAVGRRPGRNCHIHPLDGDGFLRRMADCRAFVTSAGFESLCEAYYLGKPTLAVPTPHQVEQSFNGADADASKVAVSGSFDMLDSFWRDATPPEASRVAAFRDWVDCAPSRVVAAVEEAASC